MELELEQVRALLQAAREFDVQELEVSRGERRIVIKRGAQASGNAAPHYHVATQAHEASASGMATRSAGAHAAAAAGHDESSDVYITSPFVGTFYRSPSPDAPSFVEVGQPIRLGQVLCIVEAMKLMNEIEADVEGVLAEALMENGQPVEFGDRLFRLAPRRA